MAEGVKHPVEQSQIQHYHLKESQIFFLRGATVSNSGAGNSCKITTQATCKEHAKNMQSCDMTVQRSRKNVFRLKGDRKCSWRWQRLVTGRNNSNQSSSPRVLLTLYSSSIIELSTQVAQTLQNKNANHFRRPRQCFLRLVPSVNKAKYRLNVRHYLRHNIFSEAQMIYLEIYHLLKDAHGCFPLFWRAAEE